MKKSIMYYVLCIMGFFLLALPILHTTSYILPVYAVDSTPSADIKVKLEELKKEIASKAAKLKQEVNRKLKDKAYVGKVKQKSKNSLTIATLSGPKIVSINQDTSLPKKTLAEENYIASLGDVDETGVLTAKKVILLPTTNEQYTNPSGLKTFLWGQIISVSDNLVTLKDKSLKSIAVSIPPSSRVNTNDFVILTGNFNKNDIFEAEFLYVIPQGGFLRSKKTATPSARTSTSSAKPKPSTH